MLRLPLQALLGGLLAAALLLLGGCTAGGLSALTTDQGYTLSQDVPYDRANKLNVDIYSPSDAKNAPVVVFFFGGRWEKGDKSEYKFVGQALASRGFVTILANYRLYPRVHFPDFIKDGANAVKWAHDNAAQYGGNPQKLFVMGHSSGAHIAAMLALNEEYLKAVGGSRSWLTGMIGLAGPYDFLPITAPDLRDLFGPVERFPYTQPIFFVDGQNPPLFLVHGENDEIVDVANTKKLAQAVSRAGGPVETLLYPKLSHELIIGSFASVLRGRSDVLDQVEDFIKRRAAAAASANARDNSINAVPLQVEEIQLAPTTIPEEGIGTPQPIVDGTQPPRPIAPVNP
ncbi:Acetyl esterase/lipase [Solimonas aquatica]|uniref:Acetyl esterase/lipase n=1 Tax=Solimonas aquatica TaxID=489703 RepID=A0A1H9BMD1_9GAMM|nr:alpha/beta hydrolase [Solimonas aquatica]SEP89891.1 Acetyl esterase/lipase [Solimonas aquatica]